MVTGTERRVLGQRWQRVAIGLGANLGRRRETVAQAVVTIADHLLCPVISQPVESAPEDAPTDSPAFVNAVLAGLTRREPEDLLAVLKALEYAAGRRLGPRNAPRVLDCDLLVYGNLTIDTPELTLPHPRLRERTFWTAPLATVAPDLQPPACDTDPPGPTEPPRWSAWSTAQVASFVDAGVRLAEADGISPSDADYRPD